MLGQLSISISIDRQPHGETKLGHENNFRYVMIKFIPVSAANRDIANEDGFTFLFRVAVSGYGISSAKFANCET